MSERIPNLPNHVAIIMDGNRRWARQHGLPTMEGHRQALKNLHSLLEYLADQEIKYATVFLFSTENWNRSEAEVSGLFHLFEETLKNEVPELHRRGVRIRHLGRLEKLPERLKTAFLKAIELTRDNTRLNLSLAVNYGGRAEIVDAIRQIVTEGIPAEQIDEKVVRERLYTDGIPDVDFLIRTSGEIRISNFLIWQSAYAEFYFTNVLWPDFTREELGKALLAYSQRQRRFGGD